MTTPELTFFKVPDCVVQDLWNLHFAGYITFDETIEAITSFGQAMQEARDELDTLYANCWI